MIYGSSPIVNPNLIGITGQTGITGPIGYSGARGPTGNPGNSGSTGPSLIGMTLTISSPNYLVNIFDNDTSINALSVIRGSTGNYYLFADADILSNQFNIIYGVSYFYSDNDSYPKNIIAFRGITTNDSRLIKINKVANGANGAIDINYNLFNITSLELDPPYFKNSIIYTQPGLTPGVDEEFKGLENTLYNTETSTYIGQIKNYSERIQFIDAISIPLGTDLNRRIFYWPIDWEDGNIIKLNPYVSSGQTVVAQIIYVKSPNNEFTSEGMTIVIPSGITSSNTFTTLFATTEDLDIVPDINNLNQNISWPLSVPPCITQNIDILNLISIGNIWYADFSHRGMTFKNSEIDLVGDLSKIPSLINITEDLYNCANGSNVFGYCCPSQCGITGYETIEVLCNGVFYLGMTGSTCDNICFRTGVCCLVTSNQTVQKLPDFVAECECASFAQTNSSTYIWTPKDNNIVTVNDVDCNSSILGLGGCCDGRGNCTQETAQDCLALGGFYQGLGVNCQLANGTLLCRGGTGGCCMPLSNTCENNYTFDNCMQSNGIYFGVNTVCSDFECSSTCLNTIPGIPPLTIGSEFEGGIVAGIFNTQKSLCLGNKKFGGIPLNFVAGLNENEILGSTAIFNYLTNGDEINAELYYSRSDKIGYGFTHSVNHLCEEDTWILIVGKYPINLIQSADPFDAVSDDITNNQSLKTFTWSHGGTYFGFALDNAYNIPVNLENDDFTCPQSVEMSELGQPELYVRDEGWYAFKDSSNVANGITYYGNRETFKSCSDYFNNCPIKRASLIPLYARVGSEKIWRRNWGLYNTIMMVGAELWANKDTNPELNSSLYNFNFGQGFTFSYDQWQTSQQSAGEAISAYNICKSESVYSPKLSKWYIPSVDELSFIAHKISSEDLNGKILAANGVPIGDSGIGADGWVWTSTGTFNEANQNEYIQTKGIGYPATSNDAPQYNVKHGTEAWAMKFNQTNISDIKIGKKNRLDKYEVRPVRMIRCDGKYYDINSTDNTLNNPAKYWNYWNMAELPLANMLLGPD